MRRLPRVPFSFGPRSALWSRCRLFPKRPSEDDGFLLLIEMEAAELDR